MKVGIIAETLGKTPASVGYDIVAKRPGMKFCKGPQDYELLFRGFTATNSAKALNVLENFDKSLERIYDDEIKTQHTIKEELNDDVVLADLQGEVIKQIVMKNGKEGANLTDDLTKEQTKIVNTLLKAWAELRLMRIDVERDIARHMRKGTLDIWVKDGTETLRVFDGDENYKDAPEMVKADQIKASLFFLLDLHYKMDRFKAAINCEHQEGEYVLSYEKGVLEFGIVDRDATDFEIAVMSDIKKIKL